jgi:DNA ligase-1
VLLARIVETSQTVAATRSRKAKVVALAETLRDADADDLPTVVAYLGGSLLQRRTGVGWRGIGSPPEPADEPTLTVAEVHAAFDHLAGLSGPGSQATRAAAVKDLLGRATADEQGWLRGVITGNVRQGALDALVQEGWRPPRGPAQGRPTCGHARGRHRADRQGGVRGRGRPGEFGLEVGRPVLPMLASSAPDVAAAMAKAGGGPVAIDTKLDGIRIQVHKSGDDVLIATRSLDVITDRLPEVVDVVRALPAERLVLDGEALALADDGRPRPFQETASRTAMESGVHVTPYFFDLLHLDGTNLLDRPGTERWAALASLVPEQHRTPSLVTDSPEQAEEFVRETLARGHEGVVVKSVDGPYDAGRRGSAWVKVKPVHTLDLVVLAVEWGSGRREGWLSNIHLGARDRRRRLRDARQDVQGDDRRDARVADRAVHRAGARARADQDHYVVRCARAGRRDRLRRPPALDALPRRAGPALRAGRPLPRRQGCRRGRHDQHGAVVRVDLRLGALAPAARGTGGRCGGGVDDAGGVRREAVRRAPEHRLRAPVDTDLAVRRTDVGLHRVDTQVGTIGDLLVAQDLA